MNLDEILPDARVHALLGLDHTMQPAKAREAITTGEVVGLVSSEIKQNLFNIATTIYTHQKLAPALRTSAGYSDNLAFFVCAIRGKQPCESAEALSHAKLQSNVHLPLCHWESVYYAVVADIRRDYREIQQRFDKDFANGQLILHDHGWNGRNTHQPFTALDYASQLEGMWLLLMDPRLLGPLENAVRIEKIAQDYCESLDDETYRQHFLEDWEMLDDEEMDSTLADTAGMLDANALTPEEIIEVLWKDFAPMAQRLCLRTFGVEIKLAASRAELQTAPDNTEGDTIAPSHPHCSCHDTCACRIVCQFEVEKCSCAVSRARVQDLVFRQQARNDHALNTLTLAEKHTASSHFLGAVTNDVARLQIAALAQPENSDLTKACFTTDEVAQRLDQKVLTQLQAQSGASKLDLAYVPKTLSRGVKDTCPLEFYRRRSGQRYPILQPQASAAPPPVYGASCYSTAIPSRKPVPVASHPTNESPQPANRRGASLEPSPMPMVDTVPETNCGGIIYPAIPRSLSRDLFTSSWPPVSAITSPDKRTVACNPGTLDIDMTSAEDNAKGEPACDRYCPPAEGRSSDPTPVSEGLGAPRKVVKQRYVSAGGNAKLEDRPVLAEFSLPTSLDPGIYMHKEELLQKLNEVGSFGRSRSEGPIGRPAVPISGKRASADSVEAPRGSKRDRTDSFSSMRGKLKRVFSRKSSGSEENATL